MIEDVIKVEDQFYILATSCRADDRTLVLKHGETFAVFDHYGDILPIGLGEQGIYHEGTRFLSRFELRLGNKRPLLLSSTIRDDNDLLTVDLTNPDMPLGEDTILPRGTIHIHRAKFLWEGTCYERLEISNHGLVSVELWLTLEFDSDFADIFEVRGVRRERRGERREGKCGRGSTVLEYQGLDNIVRRTLLECTPAPHDLTPNSARFRFHLHPRASTVVHLTITCQPDRNMTQVLSYDNALSTAVRSLEVAQTARCDVFTSNEQFNEWLNRSLSDLHMMITNTPCGPYPYAGVPWYSTAFGRDGILTALELLWLNPQVARGVLRYLASTQAAGTDPEQDAEPGKILHETRKGEMAALKDVPFGLYYGSVDATPLFVVLAGAYYERTADRDLIQSIWPNIERALKWVDTCGDSDGDGFVEYFRKTPKGLLHQGWKDSQDPVFHADGMPAEGPIALCEVQGYVYAAKKYAAQLALALGLDRTAEELAGQAENLRGSFEDKFWCEELSTYALALDGEKRPCRVRTSNAGHCLFTGIAGQERARLTAQTLLNEDSFSGWGIRTVSKREIRYNPMSYHNGSVWPHDNAIIALGLSRYGFSELVNKTMNGMFDAGVLVDLHRLPELFCGFGRRHGHAPTLYPVACAPQSWAAASVFMFLQACLGMFIDATRKELFFKRPRLPEFLQEVRIAGLKLGDASVDLLFERHANDVGINVSRREGDFDIIVIK